MADLFITLQDVSDRLGRDLTGDPGGTAAISEACAYCRSEAQQAFNAGTTTVYLDGTGSDCLILPESSQTVGTVTVGGSVITDYTVAADGRLLRGVAGAEPRPVWPSGRQNVQVDFSYGYPYLGVPEDVCGVALQIAMRLIVQGIAADESVGEANVTYAQRIAQDLTENERRILRRYRNPRSF